MKRIRTIALLLTGLLLGAGLTKWLHARAHKVIPPNAQIVDYYCSMHPEARQATLGKCPICHMDLVPEYESVAADDAVLAHHLLASQNLSWLYPTTPDSIEYHDVFFGQIRLADDAVFRQVSHLPGRIEKMYKNQVGQYVRKGDRIASIYSKELIAAIETFEFSKRSESILRSAENNMLSWRIDPNDAPKYNVHGTHRKAFDIRADFSGTIIKVLAREGDHAMNTHMGHPTVLYEVAHLHKLWAEIHVPPQWIEYIQKGDVLTFTTTRNAQPYRATVVEIEPMVDALSHYVVVRARIEDPRDAFRVDEDIVVDWREYRPNKTLVIPRSSLIWGGQKTYVFVSDSTHSPIPVRLQAVSVRSLNDREALIESGLTATDRIIARGAYLIDNLAGLKGQVHFLSQNGHSASSAESSR